MTGSPLDKIKTQALESKIVEVLRTIYDPEIPVNIYDLGLIYGIHLDQPGKANLKMTLTSPACPVAGTLPPEVERRVMQVDEIQEASVEIVWDPPWTPARMTDAAKLELGLDLDVA